MFTNRFTKDVGTNQPLHVVRGTTKWITNEFVKQEAMHNPRWIIGGVRSSPNLLKNIFNKKSIIGVRL